MPLLTLSLAPALTVTLALAPTLTLGLSLIAAEPLEKVVALSVGAGGKGAEWEKKLKELQVISHIGHAFDMTT